MGSLLVKFLVQLDEGGICLATRAIHIRERQTLNLAVLLFIVRRALQTDRGSPKVNAILRPEEVVSKGVSEVGFAVFDRVLIIFVLDLLRPTIVKTVSVDQNAVEVALIFGVHVVDPRGAIVAGDRLGVPLKAELFHLCLSFVWGFGRRLRF